MVTLIEMLLPVTNEVYTNLKCSQIASFRDLYSQDNKLVKGRVLERVMGIDKFVRNEK
jgi:hypothetical protein